MAARTMREAIELICEPFPPEEIEWRVHSSGESGGKPWARVVPYITARAVHDRLDAAFDPWGWRTEFKVMQVPSGEPGVLCRLHYRNPETGEWDWKENGAGQTYIEAFKGGLSDAEKRVFEELGGGRYLYRLEVDWADVDTRRTEKCPHFARTREGTIFYWGPPLLPDFAIPRVKKEVQDLAAEVTGGQLRLPGQYDRFDSIVAKYAGKRGVNSLRAVAVIARSMGWDEPKLMEWVKQTGIDIVEGAKQSNFDRLKMLIEEVKENADD